MMNWLVLLALCIALDGTFRDARRFANGNTGLAYALTVINIVFWGALAWVVLFLIGKL